MAYPTGVDFKLTSPFAGAQPINEVSSTQKHPLGMVARAFDFAYGEGEFIYLAGVASTAAGDVCGYNSKTGATVRAVHDGATSLGPLCVAMAATIDSTYGWYCVAGSVPVTAATVLANGLCYLTSTAGTVDDAAVSGDLITGMLFKAATSSGYATAQLARPSVTQLGNAESIEASLTTLIGTAQTTADAAVPKTGLLKITLSAAVEAAQAIVVTGAITDMAGTAVAVAKEVVVRSLAVTDDKGDITVTSGTSRKVHNPTAGPSMAWITSTAGGAFAVSIANDVAERTVVTAECSGIAAPAVLELVFT